MSMTEAGKRASARAGGSAVADGASATASPRAASGTEFSTATVISSSTNNFNQGGIRWLG